MSSSQLMASAKLADAQDLLPDDFRDFLTRNSGYTCVAVRKHNRPWSSKEFKDKTKYVWLLVELHETLHSVNKKYFGATQFGRENENIDLSFALAVLDGHKLDLNMLVSQLPCENQLLVLQASITAKATPIATPTDAIDCDQRPIPIKSEFDSPYTLGAISEEHNHTHEISNPLAEGSHPQANTPTLVKSEIGSHKALILPPSYHVDCQHRNEENISQSQTLIADSNTENSISVGTKSTPLKRLTREQNIERLEAGVVTGLEVLSAIEQELSRSQDASTWLPQIEEIRKEAARPPTIIGVVGNTGAGKSSVINAMLDEEQLVPTNCMRACTAVVTEISYNYSPYTRYRADIEFIKPEDWRKELETLFDAVFDENGRVSRTVFLEDSEASIAYAKIRAVYNQYTNDMLQNTTVDALMREENVSSVLGSISRLSAQDPVTFSRKLQQFVDSAEKNTGQPKLNARGHRIGHGKRRFGYWPLVKVVKIYAKAEALSTGAVIVDLPGIHDSNVARAAIAESYIMRCTGLWIVAPITRAVDDKAAKVLLGKTFKRQLQFDNAYSALTFICSKTDDISITESTRSLQLGEPMAELRSRATSLRSSNSQLRQQRELVEEELTTVNAAVRTLKEQIEGRKAFLGKAEAARLMQHLSVVVDSDASTSRPRKRARYDDDEICPTGHCKNWPSDESLQEQFSTEEREIQMKLKDTESKLEKTRDHQHDLIGKREEINEQLKSINDQIVENKLQRSNLCIAGRNEYARKAIQQDFASGIRELDMAHKEEEDPGNFDPNDETRDYDLLAQQLSVFCVSSRGYQQLCNRFRKDASVNGFNEVKQTEIPQLQDHCKQVTARARKASYDKFLNSLQQLIDSIKLWASGKNDFHLTAEQYSEEKAFINDSLDELESKLKESVDSVVHQAACTVKTQLMTKFGRAARRAQSTAMPTCLAWGAPRDMGGLSWGTYKAVVRYNGVFHSPTAGLQDFNRALAEPILETLASSWETAFQRRLPKVFPEFSSSARLALDALHNTIENRCHQQEYGTDQIDVMRNQIQTYSIMLRGVASSAQQMLSDGQKSSNREFTPAIARSMEPAFVACAKETGKGQYERMKNIMADHVKSEAQHMFQTAADQVQNSLTGLCKAIEIMMFGRVDEILANIRRDYLSLLGVEVTDVACSPAIETAARKAVLDVLVESETTFLDVLEVDTEDLRRRYKSVNDLAAEAFEKTNDSCQVGDDEEERSEDSMLEEDMDFED